MTVCEAAMFCLFVLPFWVMISLYIWGDVAEHFISVWKDLRRRWKE